MSIIFDMDGTLLESMAMWNDTGNQYLIQKGYQLKEPVCLVESEHTYNENLQKIIDDYHLKQTVPQLKAEFDMLITDEYYHKLQLKPHVLDFLNQQKEKGTPMAVATATDSKLACACFRRLNILSYFCVVLSTRDVGVNKFKPDIYLKCLDYLKTDINQTMVFEDAPYAVKTAKDAGFYTVAVYEPLFDSEFKNLQQIADRTIYSYSELLTETNNQKL